jgi:hypothetical protein
MLVLSAASLLTMPPLVALAQTQTLRPSLMDSFRIGTGGGALCQAQSNAADPAVSGMFDRSWAVVCRDSVLPVGRMFALRGAGNEAQAALVQRVIASRDGALSCGPAEGITLEGASARASPPSRAGASPM